jgi:hypothetical protein
MLGRKYSASYQLQKPQYSRRQVDITLACQVHKCHVNKCQMNKIAKVPSCIVVPFWSA